jgi:hypothetical protein
MRDREISAARERERVELLIAQARAAGNAWAVLHGPELPADLGDGSSVVMHVASGTVLTATVDIWSGGPPYRLELTPTEGTPASEAFSDRAEWLAAHQRYRSELEAAPPNPAPEGPT